MAYLVSRPETHNADADGQEPARVFRTAEGGRWAQAVSTHQSRSISVLKFDPSTRSPLEKAHGKSGCDLSETRTAEMFGNETGEDDNRGLREDCGKVWSQTTDTPKKREGDVLDEGSEWWVGTNP